MGVAGERLMKTEHLRGWRRGGGVPAPVGSDAPAPEKTVEKAPRTDAMTGLHGMTQEPFDTTVGEPP